MPDPHTPTAPGLPTRLPPISGGIVLALTATPWLQKTFETSDVDVHRTYTLWGMLATVNSRYLGLLLLAILILISFAVISIALPPDLIGPRALVAWLALLATIGIVVFTDNGYSPGAGTILTLITCAVTALVTSLSPLLRRRAAAAESGSPMT